VQAHWPWQVLVLLMGRLCCCAALAVKVLTFLTMPVNTTSARPQEQQQLIDKIKVLD